MPQPIRLIMVTGQNNNKFYDMTEDNSQLRVEYGRVGVTKAVKMYPIFKWDSLYKAKIKKGYKDVTGYRLQTTGTDFTVISDGTIAAIVAELQALANRSVQRNYTVSSDAVTQAQIEEAQRLLDLLVGIKWSKAQADKFNKNLLDLFQIIPRRMAKVQDHMVRPVDDKQHIGHLIATEQATLDVMKGQVHVNQAKQDNTAEDPTTILDAMGLSIQLTTPTDVELIKKELGQIKNQYKRSFCVINKRTQERFDKFRTGKKDNRKLFWHGSRNENWWSILDSGLILRPTNAVITGRMYGDGLYSADRARKSLGYTSIRGSYWAKGNAQKGFMGLFDVYLGNSYRAQKHEPWMYSLTHSKLQEKGSYDSLFAERGADLYNNEYIVYKEEQMTIRYLVEVQ
jgi:poly [ADP-ribose] polymerase